MQHRKLTVCFYESNCQQETISNTNKILLQEIDHRHHAEHCFARKKERLNLVTHATNIGVWEWNLFTGETVVNERWADILGYTLAELSPVSIETWIKSCHPDDLKRSNAFLEKHFSGELNYYDCKCRMRHRKGYWVWVQVRCKDGTVLDGLFSGEVISCQGKLHLLTVTIDITGRKQAKAHLRRAYDTMEQQVRDRTREIERIHSQMLMHEKMASIGQLAAGIAHKLNNPINFVLINFVTLSEYFTDLVEILTCYREFTRDCEIKYGLPPAFNSLRIL